MQLHAYLCHSRDVFNNDICIPECVAPAHITQPCYRSFLPSPAVTTLAVCSFAHLSLSWIAVRHSPIVRLLVAAPLALALPPALASRCSLARRTSLFRLASLVTRLRVLNFSLSRVPLPFSPPARSPIPRSPRRLLRGVEGCWALQKHSLYWVAHNKISFHPLWEPPRLNKQTDI